MYIFRKNGTDFNVYAKEVSDNSVIKVSVTWEINSRDIVHCRTEDNTDLLYTIIGRNISPSKIEVGVFINLEEMKDGGFYKEDIVKIKQFIEAYPNGIHWKEHYYEDESEKRVDDGFPIKVDVAWEKDGENWVKAIEDWNRENDSESVGFSDLTKIEHKQFNIEVGGKIVNINELMSMVNEHHDNSSALDGWTCMFPLVDYMSGA
jgi:hypothetical protein